ncbi:AAA family ATPase [Sphaerisporangium sp. NPDC005288]|uniref:caspase, EACC1-associated type n=1 Tax=Sphaerisporangium sp. NPDC005288 TaxID=3155114 RepID=UPI0033AA221E
MTLKTQSAGRALERPGSRALVAGTARHVRGSALPDVEAAATTARDLGLALVECCGLAPGRLETLVDPANPAELGSTLARAASQARGTFLFSFVGHGLLDAHGELYLATSATDGPSTGLTYKALPYSAVREALIASPAETIIVVLDCCFAGRANGAAASAISDAFGRMRVRRSHLLAAAARDEQALAPMGARHTAYTGCLLTVLREGDELGPRMLSLDDISRYLDRELPRRGFPQHFPQHFGRAGEIALTQNRAYTFPGPETRIPPAEGPCPYRGLEPFEFTADDARLFFGREELIGELVRTVGVRRTGPLFVIGPSGSGKSSVLRAGLLPALAGAEDGWLPLILTPGDSPLTALVRAMSPEEAGDDAADELFDAPHAVNRLIERTLQDQGRPTDRLILVVDQFEEVFTRCQDPAERNAFIHALCTADPARALVVPAVRADFYGYCLAYPGLLTALGAGHVPVGPMTEPQVRRAIEGPAETAGLSLEPGLVDLLLHDLRPGEDDVLSALPLLSHALLATWRNREGKTLTMSGYRAAGGIWRSVTTSAEKVHDGLDDEGREAIRRILLAGVQIGEETEDTRREIDLPGLLARAGVTPAPVIAARDALVKARLISVTEKGAEISHEALLRAWPRLREWIAEDRDELRLRQRLATAATAWHEQNRDPYLLLRGASLESAESWAAGHDHELGALEQDFLRQSRRTRRRGRIRTRLAAALGVLILMVAVAGGVTIRESRAAAEQQHRVAVSGQIAPQVASEYATGNPLGSHKLAVEAYRLAPDSVQAISALLGTQNQHFDDTLDPRNVTPLLWKAVYSPDGKTIATGGKNGEVELWDATTHRQITTIPNPAEPGTTMNITTVAFSPDGTTLAATMRGMIRLWEVTDRGHPKALPALETGDDEQVTFGAFSRDGRLLTGISAGGELRLWDVVRRRLVVAPFEVGQGSHAGFTPDTRTLVIASSDGTVRLWDVRHRRFTRSLTRHAAKLNTRLAISRDGRTLAVSAEDGGVLLWDLPRRRQMKTIAGDDAGRSVSSLAFSPDGSLLAAGGYDSHVRIWDHAAGDRPLADLTGHIAQVNSVEFSPDGATLASAGSDGVVQLWSTRGNFLNGRFSPGITVAFSPARNLLAVAEMSDVVLYSMPARRRVATFPGLGHTPMAVAFSRDGTLLAVASGDRSDRYGTVRLWDVPRQKLLRTITTHHHGVMNAIAFSPDGRTLATSAIYDPTVRLWNPADGSLRATLEGNGGDPAFTRATALTQGVQSLAYSPDGRTLAVGSFEGIVRLWDTRRNSLVGDRLSQPGSVPALAFSPDGRTLATGGGGDTLIRLYDLATRKVSATLHAHTAQINDLVYAPDGATLISASDDMTVRIWKIRDKTLLASLPADHKIVAVAYDARNRTVVATGIGPPLAWSIDPRRVAEQICGRLSKPDITPDGWKNLIPQLPYERSCDSMGNRAKGSS